MAESGDIARREQAGRSPGRAGWLRFLPLIALAGGSAAFLATGAHRYVSFEFLLSSRKWLIGLIAGNAALALAAYMATYVAAVALSIPGATILTIAGGVLFGGFAGGVAAVLAATCGATLIFLAARCSVGESLRARAGPWLETLRGGFERDAVSYMLFLRLTPAFPFFLVNLAPAVLGVGCWTFIWTTLLGILPGTFAFSYAGAGLDSVAAAQTQAFEACLATGAADCRAHIYLSQLVTRDLLYALAGLGLVALIPVVARRWRARTGAGAPWS